MSAPDRTPVIVGVGEAIDRPAELSLAKEPAALVAEALGAADRDAGGGWLRRLDRLDIVRQVSWPYADLPGVVAGLIGHCPRRLAEGPVGGETPVRFIDEAAAAIERGEIAVAAVAGGEAEWSAAAGRRAGCDLRWTERDSAWTNPRNRDYLHSLALSHGLSQPIFVYPLYETATGAAWGETPGQSRRRSAELWSRLSAVAAANPHAWITRPHGPDEIATPSAANRPIAWPYTKLTVANPVVNQGAAVILTSLARAREAGLPEERIVRVGASAAASEPRDWVGRDRYDRAAAQEAVLAAVLDRAGIAARDLDAVELYSCFPCVPKMAARSLGLPDDAVPSVAGGLTFFGAALNDYMGHAAVAMVKRLRARPGAVGLLYGQGEFVTKHHALVLGSRPLAREPGRDASVQVDADRRRGPVPPIVQTIDESDEGIAHIETATVLFDRAGEPDRGVVVLRTAGGARTLARVPAADRATLAVLMDEERTPVGRDGRLRQEPDGLLAWAAA